MLKSIDYTSLRLPLTVEDRAALSGRAAGRAAARVAMRRGEWARAGADWAPWDSWFTDAIARARDTYPDSPSVCAAWWNGIVGGWNSVGEPISRPSPSLPLAAVWS